MKTNLGKNVNYPVIIDEAILDLIPRNEQRKTLKNQTFIGVDYWNAYEFMWLDQKGYPQTRVLHIAIPTESTNMVESKSMKLYLGSYYNTVFKSESEVSERLSNVLSEKCQANVNISMSKLKHAQFSTSSDYHCIDEISQDTLFKTSSTMKLMTNAFRSICPVTSQPDYASLFFKFSGQTISCDWLRNKIFGFREVGKFHESCIESLFDDIWTNFKCTQLSILGCFTRRGGIDINPYRSNVDLNQIKYHRQARQ